MIQNIIKISNNYHIFKSFFKYYDDCPLSFKIFYDNFILMLFNTTQINTINDMSNNQFYFYILKYNDSYINDDIRLYLLDVLNNNYITFLKFNSNSVNTLYNYISKNSFIIYNWFKKHYQILFNKPIIDNKRIL